MKPKTIFLTNKELLAEIARCKNTYCSFIDSKYAAYDEIVSDLKDAQPIEGRVVRLMTWDHIPRVENKKVKARAANKTHEDVTFPPFKHYAFENGDWREVGRSHWEGGLDNGWFNAHAGRTTNRMGKMYMLFVERFARKANWRHYSYLSEMTGAALTHLVHMGLQFDESKTSNPFAYYTTVVHHCFVRVANTEKRSQELRDDLLVAAGSAPSYTRQIAHEMARQGLKEPQPLPAKRGRKSAAHLAADTLSQNSQNPPR